MRKADVLKTCRKSKFLGKKIWTNFEEQKGTRCIRGNVYFSIIVFSCLTSTKQCLRFLLICFAQEIKGFSQSYLGNKVDFRYIMNVSPNILAKNQNLKNWIKIKIKKLRNSFVDERALITTTLISFCHKKALVHFFLQKKRPESAFLTLIVNYCKIVPKSKLCHPKQQ